MNKNKVFLSEREVKSKIGNAFAREKVSFAGWHILDLDIQPNGVDAVVIMINKDLRREMKAVVSARCMTIFVTKGKKSKKKEMFTSVREAIAS